jgi:hypothetical protein
MSHSVESDDDDIKEDVEDEIDDSEGDETEPEGDETEPEEERPDFDIFLDNLLSKHTRFSKTLHNKLKHKISHLLKDHHIYYIISQNFKLKDPNRYKTFIFNANDPNLIIERLLHLEIHDCSNGTRYDFVKHLIDTKQLNPYYVNGEGFNLVEILLSRPDLNSTIDRPYSYPKRRNKIDYVQDVYNLLDLFASYGLPIDHPLKIDPANAKYLEYYQNILANAKSLYEESGRFLPDVLAQLTKGYIAGSSNFEGKLEGTYKAPIPKHQIKFLFGERFRR